MDLLCGARAVEHKKTSNLRVKIVVLFYLLCIFNSVKVVFKSALNTWRYQVSIQGGPKTAHFHA